MLSFMAARLHVTGLRELRRHARVALARVRRREVTQNGQIIAPMVSASDDDPARVLSRADRFSAALEHVAPYRRAVHDPSWPEYFEFFGGMDKKRSR
jgi:hypothetical protein